MAKVDEALDGPMRIFKLNSAIGISNTEHGYIVQVPT